MDTRSNSHTHEFLRKFWINAFEEYTGKIPPLKSPDACNTECLKFGCAHSGHLSLRSWTRDPFVDKGFWKFLVHKRNASKDNMLPGGELTIKDIDENAAFFIWVDSRGNHIIVTKKKITTKKNEKTSYMFMRNDVIFFFLHCATK